MDSLSADLQNSPEQVYLAERDAELATFQEEQALAIAFLRAREDYPSIEDAKQASKLDETYAELRAKRIIAMAKYKELSNKQINSRKLAEMAKIL